MEGDGEVMVAGVRWRRCVRWRRWWRLVMMGCRGEMRDDDGVLREDGEGGGDEERRW